MVVLFRVFSPRMYDNVYYQHVHEHTLILSDHAQVYVYIIAEY